MNNIIRFIKREWHIILTLIFLMTFVFTLNYLVEVINSNIGAAINIMSLLGLTLLYFIRENKRTDKRKKKC